MLTAAVCTLLLVSLRPDTMSRTPNLSTMKATSDGLYLQAHAARMPHKEVSVQRAVPGPSIDIATTAPGVESQQQQDK